MAGFYNWRFIKNGEFDIFTVTLLPEKTGKFPTVIYRTPYADADENTPENELCERLLNDVYSFWVEAGYAVVFQPCRGKGKSSGEFIPYINERSDGLFVQNWIRTQDFYNGEIYLAGGSYGATVHLVTAPFADDIKGAIIDVQDTFRYNCSFRNGIFKIRLTGAWHAKHFKHKQIRKKYFTYDTFKMLPLSDFSKTVFGESDYNIDETMKHPKRDDPFWKETALGGSETYGVLDHVRIPILLITGFYDIYTGGIFNMWRAMDDEAKAMTSFVIHPLEHGGIGRDQPIVFEDGILLNKFGDFRVKFFDSIRGKCDAPFEKGKVTYYKLFDNKWICDDFYNTNASKRISLGEGSVSYKYNPYAPAVFQGGLSTNFDGNAWQDPPNSRYDIISLFSEEFKEDTYVKGKMTAKLKVSSDCEDTCFYLRLSLAKEEGYYGLRDDINQISNFAPDYVPGETLDMDFSFDEHSFLVKKGEKIRIDISSSAFPFYVPHTNNRGPFYEHTTAKVANNTVILGESYLDLPILK